MGEKYCIKTIDPQIFPIKFYIAIVDDDYADTNEFTDFISKEFEYLDGGICNIVAQTFGQCPAKTIASPVRRAVNMKSNNDGTAEVTYEYGICIILTYNATLNAVIHESVHAAMCACDHLGLNIEDQELLAYLIGYLVDNIHKIKQWNWMEEEDKDEDTNENND